MIKAGMSYRLKGTPEDYGKTWSTGKWAVDAMLMHDGHIVKALYPHPNNTDVWKAELMDGDSNGFAFWFHENILKPMCIFGDEHD